MDTTQTQNPIEAIKKRNGETAPFDRSKITSAIDRAFAAVGRSDPEEAGRLTEKVIQKLYVQGFSSSKPSVEDIQDMVESTLIENEHSSVAKAFILYRHERRKVRDEKMRVLNTASLDPVASAFDANSLRVLASRYLLRNHRSDVQRRILAILGYGKSEMEARFGFLLNALESGAPPHGGFAYGFDRIVMLMAGADNLRDVIAFPKTQRGQDLLMGAPSEAAAAQLSELGLQLPAPPPADPADGA